MNVKFLNPFVDATCEVILVETSIKMSRGELSLEKEPYVTDDVMVIISLVGKVVGNVIFGMSKETALALASKIMGEPFSDFNMLAQSGIAELGNVITGKASVKLTEAGFESVISPPTMLQGKGATISTLDIARLVVPFHSEVGTISIHLALREGTQRTFSAAQTPVAQSMV
jgi:chemotaxis protein CheX